VLLVGAGVGVTPFLSMLADAVEQQGQQAADAAKHSYCSGGAFCGPACARSKSRKRQPVQKVHFHWLVREPTVPR
jgi:predicted ferric reductase